MRRSSHPLSLPAAILIALVVASVPIGIGIASKASPKPPAGTGFQRAQAAQAQHEARMLARLHPHAPLSAPPQRVSGSPGSISHVQPISRDTLPTFETSQLDTLVEPDVAVDPNQPKFVVAGTQESRFADGGASDVGYATSQDGGKTWTKGDLPGLTEIVGGEFERASDPAVAFGPDGSVYEVTIPFGSKDNPNLSAVTIQRSEDHGLTFGPGVDVQRDTTFSYFNDKEWVTVDTYPSSPHYGRVYVTWSRFGPQYAPAELRFSDDRGQTWSKMFDISDPTALTEGTLPIVQRNGDLTVVYDQTIGVNDFEVSQTSHNGGKSFDPPVTVAQFEGSGVPGMRTGGLPADTVDPITGVLYVAWQDSRFKRNGYNDIVLSWSTDGGKKWTDPAKVNPDPPSSNVTHFTPDVAAFDGNVYVTYGTRASVGGVFLDTAQERVSISPDGGVSFEKEKILGPTIELNWAAVAGAKFLGDYTGVAASSSGGHAAWTVATKPPFDEPHHQILWGANLSA